MQCRQKSSQHRQIGSNWTGNNTNNNVQILLGCKLLTKGDRPLWVDNCPWSRSMTLPARHPEDLTRTTEFGQKRPCSLND